MQYVTLIKIGQEMQFMAVDVLYQKDFLNGYVLIFPVETSVPINYRRNRDRDILLLQISNGYSEVPNRFARFSKTSDPSDRTSGVYYSWTIASGIEEWESFRLDPVFLYNYPRSIYRFFPKQPNAIIPKTFDCRIWKSEIKTDGETVESWSVL
jgi:hypothetical protein